MNPKGRTLGVLDKVEVVYTFDPSTHPKIVYPIVLPKRGAENDAAVRGHA